MQYQVLARKWRPQNFHELVGQEHISRTLLNALRSGRVAHAFLFSGPRGSGKTTTARVLAKALNCHAGQPGQPCGKCPACVEIAEGNSMDVLEIDAASNRGIDEIRELREKVRYSPARDKHKIFIIDEVHMLTAEAFNALLKTLEEPPPRVIFILATTEYHKIPATILSRCQQHNFKLIPYSLVLHRLSEVAGAEKIRISTRALEQIAYSSGGSLRDAMSALDQVIAFSGEDVRDEDVTMLLGLVEP
ncbi:MAG: DNA polymerase III subunit gamma/tau, partial [Acidobacteria bacterium]